jgi:hypothetical protein
VCSVVVAVVAVVVVVTSCSQFLFSHEATVPPEFWKLLGKQVLWYNDLYHRFRAWQQANPAADVKPEAQVSVRVRASVRVRVRASVRVRVRVMVRVRVSCLLCKAGRRHLS